ncbi:MAG TPA: hypothetical protein VFP98_09245, partial [Candidatus Polarisedimenticolia bacterium]|nr:hypothetical protein [Candidatus Polarisedimenticolia bacterium]
YLRSILLDVAYRAERWDQAGAMDDSVLALEPGNVRALWRLASVAARRGDRAEAERLIGVIEARRGINALGPYRPPRPSDAVAESWLAGAGVAALFGDRHEAVRVLSRALAHSLGYPFDLLHHEKDFEPLQDFPPFQALLRPKE